MKIPLFRTSAVVFILSVQGPIFGEQKAEIKSPEPHVFSTPGGTELNLYVVSAAGAGGGSTRAAIVIFYGGGWSMGDASWSFDRARHFSEKGMVAIAAQYRLSNQKDITPLDAMADARAAMCWVRIHAKELNIDPDRIAAYGWSAGGHLATCTATFIPEQLRETVSCAPNALLLVSPAVAIGSDSWAQKLLGNKCKASEISPDRHVRPGMPPTIIVEGREDTVTPLPGVQKFAETMKEAGNRCELYVFDGAGHLFTPVGTPDDGFPKPDPTIESAAFAKLDAFLISLGYIK